MSNLAIVEQVMLQGNLKALAPEQKIEYYAKVCESLGLNPLTKPFEYITLNGKEVLYATKACTEQLRLNRKVSIKIADRQTINGVYVVTAEAKDNEGREDSATGAVSIDGLKGDALANAFMKAETKAKRRVTLSICGLGMLDESELETIPKAAMERPAVRLPKAPVNSHPVNEPIPPAFSDSPPIEAYQDGGAMMEEQESSNVDENFIITFGKKYNGRTIGSIPKQDVDSYVSYLKNSRDSTGKPFSKPVEDFIIAAGHQL